MKFYSYYKIKFSPYRKTSANQSFLTLITLIKVTGDHSMSLALSEPMHALPEIKEKIRIALEAAEEQLNFLIAIISKPDFLSRAAIEQGMTKYSNQMHQMKLLRQQCADWLQIPSITETYRTSIFELEIASFKLDRWSEKILYILRHLCQLAINREHDDFPCNHINEYSPKQTILRQH